MDGMEASIEEADGTVGRLIKEELSRQRTQIELIASENFVPASILEAMGSVLTNKYAEGYPHKKYYGGCEYVEQIEEIAIERAKALFGADHANVQPHSGSTANQAAYFSVMRPGDTMLSMRLDHGGHLSHGHPINFTGKMYKIAAYGVNAETETIDYDDLARLARESRPKVIVAGASAYPRSIDFKRFREIADETGAILITDMAHIAGLVAGGAHENPAPYSDFVTSTTHKTLRGPRGAFVLCKDGFAQDLDRTVFPGIQGGPLLPAIAGKAICFKLASEPRFKEYARQVVKNASALAGALQERGFRLVSGGTDNHMMLVDLRPKALTGKAAERLLHEAGITSNKNAIPFDPEKPMVTSGLRFGTAAVTTRGMTENEMTVIADAIDGVLSAPDDAALRKATRSKMTDLCLAYPLYKNL
ncbi:MAG: serine hydroxymethyltransferase [Synergistaceae bacterium]|jgi:glycine hydroxymethyltransferase|nr:serine hydroxymethyltransferase [Synergistaceae bacterium]